MTFNLWIPTWYRKSRSNQSIEPIQWSGAEASNQTIITYEPDRQLWLSFANPFRETNSQNFQDLFLTVLFFDRLHIPLSWLGSSSFRRSHVGASISVSQPSVTAFRLWFCPFSYLPQTSMSNAEVDKSWSTVPSFPVKFVKTGTDRKPFFN